MGIKHLNQFVRRECPGAIKTVAFADLAGKTVVVDASIYMYRFAADQALLENMYSMITMFQLRGIVPVFIFDGKPPVEKRGILNKRTRMKRIAETHYNRVKNAMNLIRTPDDEHVLKTLKRRFIRLQDADFERVKALMQALGVSYVVAPGEADALCAQMVLKRKAHACVSDDTDMFVHGCPRVLRHINLFDETMTMYNMSQILALLGINMTEFRQICVVSGTDYNSGSMRGLNLKVALHLFKQYKKCRQDAEESGDVFAPDFCTWLHHNGDQVTGNRIHFNYDDIVETCTMFDTRAMPNQLSLVYHHFNARDDELLHKIMAHENFIFMT
jgi:flap endonuclease-1